MAKSSDRQAGVERHEFEALRRAVDGCCRDLEVQFERISQIQAELDQIRAAWSKGSRRQSGK